MKSKFENKAINKVGAKVRVDQNGSVVEAEVIFYH